MNKDNAENARSGSEHHYAGYPVAEVKLLRCPVDGGELELAHDGANSQTSTHVWNGSLHCSSCDHAIPVREGIVRMLDEGLLDDEETLEVDARDKEWVTDADWVRPPHVQFEDKLVIAGCLPVLKATDSIFLELACGVGRFTTVLKDKCRFLLAVDFSIAGLNGLAAKLNPDDSVGLVHGDVTRLSVAPRSFTRVFSTTNLDSREQRLMMHKISADALTDEGRYVPSANYYGPRKYWGTPRAYRIGEHGFYFCSMDTDDMLREVAPYFGKARIRYIWVELPGVTRLGYRMAHLLCRASESIPIVRQIAKTILVCAENPIRPPVEGEVTAGIGIVKAVHDLYQRFGRRSQ